MASGVGPVQRPPSMCHRPGQTPTSATTPRHSSDSSIWESTPRSELSASVDHCHKLTHPSFRPRLASSLSVPCAANNQQGATPAVQRSQSRSLGSHQSAMLETQATDMVSKRMAAQPQPRAELTRSPAANRMSAVWESVDSPNPSMIYPSITGCPASPESHDGP